MTQSQLDELHVCSNKSAGSKNLEEKLLTINHDNKIKTCSHFVHTRKNIEKEKLTCILYISITKFTF